MKAASANSYSLTLSKSAIRALPADELEQLAQCILFVPTTQPPRVGTPVELVLVVETSPAVTLPAIVVWWRPARPGTSAGFRAQLKAAPAGLPERLRALAEEAYLAASQRPATPLVIEERVTSREVTNPLRMPRAHSIAPPTRPPMTAPPTRPPTRPPLVAEAPPDLALDTITREARTATIPAAVGSGAPTRPQRPPAAPQASVVVRFSSHRNYLLHFEQFIEKGLIYLPNAPNVQVGMRVSLTIEVPDGDPPLQTVAVIERAIQPPEVPDAGWVARFEDADGSVAERCATASFIVS